MSQQTSKINEEEQVQNWLNKVPKLIAYDAIGKAIHVNNGRLPEIIFEKTTDTDKTTILHVKGLENVQKWEDVSDEIVITYDPEILTQEDLEKAMEKALQQPYPVISQNHCVSYAPQADDDDSSSFYEQILDEQSKPAYYFKHTFGNEAQKNKYLQSNNINYQYAPNKPVIVNNNIPGQQQYLSGPKNSNYGMQLPQPFNSSQNKSTMTDPNDLLQPQPGQRLIDTPYPPGDIRSVIQKVGKDNFLSDSNHELEEMDIEYNWESDGERKGDYKSWHSFSEIQNSPNQGCFPIIKEMIEAVLDYEELEKVKYSTTQQRIVLPKSAFDDEKVGPRIQGHYKTNSPYAKYIEQVLEDIKNSPKATKPKNQKELIFFAIKRIKAAYQAARFYYGLNDIDNDLIEYSKKIGHYIEGDQNTGMLFREDCEIKINDELMFHQRRENDQVKGIKYRGNKLIDWRGPLDRKLHGESDNEIDPCPLNTGRKLKRQDFEPFPLYQRRDDYKLYNNDDNYDNSFLCKIYAIQPLDKDLFQHKYKIWHDNYEITKHQLDIYQNAATLAALDGKVFPSKDDENQNKYYLKHAYWYTLFKINGKNLCDYVEPDLDAPQHYHSDDDANKNPYQIDQMVINTEGRGCRKLNDTTKTTIADNEAITQHLLNFAIFGIQLPNVEFDKDACDDKLIKFYQKMAKPEEHLWFKSTGELYDVSSIRWGIIRQAVMWGQQNDKGPDEVIKDLADNLENKLKNISTGSVLNNTNMWNHLIQFVTQEFNQRQQINLDIWYLPWLNPPTLYKTNPVQCFYYAKNPSISLQRNGQDHTYTVLLSYTDQNNQTQHALLHNAQPNNKKFPFFPKANLIPGQKDQIWVTFNKNQKGYVNIDGQPVNLDPVPAVGPQANQGQGGQFGQGGQGPGQTTTVGQFGTNTNQTTTGLNTGLNSGLNTGLNNTTTTGLNNITNPQFGQGTNTQIPPANQGTKDITIVANGLINSLGKTNNIQQIKVKAPLTVVQLRQEIERQLNLEQNKYDFLFKLKGNIERRLSEFATDQPIKAKEISLCNFWIVDKQQSIDQNAQINNLMMNNTNLTGENNITNMQQNHHTGLNTGLNSNMTNGLNTTNPQFGQITTTNQGLGIHTGLTGLNANLNTTNVVQPQKTNNNVNEQPIEVDLNDLPTTCYAGGTNIKILLKKHDQYGKGVNKLEPVDINNLYYTIAEDNGNCLCFWIGDCSQTDNNGNPLCCTGIPINAQNLPESGQGQNVSFKFLCNKKDQTLKLQYTTDNVWRQLPPGFIKFFLEACQQPAAINNSNSNTSNQVNTTNMTNNNTGLNTGLNTGINTGINNISPQNLNNNAFQPTETTNNVTEQPPIRVDLNNLNITYDPNKKDEIKMELFNHNKNDVSNKKEPVSVDAKNLCYAIEENQDDHGIRFFIGDSSQTDTYNNPIHYICIQIDNINLPGPGQNRTVRFDFTGNNYCQQLNFPYEDYSWHPFSPDAQSQFIEFCRKACQQPAVANINNNGDPTNLNANNISNDNNITT